MFAKKAINVDMLKNKAQITVVNNEKVYNLLKMVTYRSEQKRIAKKSEPEKLPVTTLIEEN